MALRYRLCLLWLAVQLSLVGVMLLPGDRTIMVNARPKPPEREFIAVPVPLKNITVTNLKLGIGTHGSRQKIAVFKATYDVTLHNPVLIHALKSTAPANLKVLPLKGIKTDLIDLQAGVATFQALSATTDGPLGFDAQASSLSLADSSAQIPLAPSQAAGLTKLKGALQKQGSAVP